MSTHKLSEAEIRDASAGRDREKLARELEELAEKRLMRERYAEQYLRKLFAESAPVSNISQEKEAKETESQDFYKVVEDVAPEEKKFDFNFQKEEKEAEAAIEEPVAQEELPLSCAQVNEKEHIDTDASSAEERIVINKHYGGYSDGIISLPGASFVITGRKEPVTCAFRIPSERPRSASVPIDNGVRKASERRFAVIPTVKFPKDNEADFSSLEMHSDKEAFYANEPISYPSAADLDSDFEINIPYGYADSEGHRDEPKYDYTAEPAFDGYNAQHYDYGAEPEQKHRDEPKYDYTAEPAFDGYNAPHYDYGAEPEQKHRDEPRYDYTAEPAFDGYNAPHYDYGAEPEQKYYDEPMADFLYNDRDEDKRGYNPPPSSNYGMDEEYLRFLKEYEEFERKNRRKRQSEQDARGENAQSVSGSGIAAAIQTSNRAVEKRMLYMIGKSEHNIKIREYTFGVHAAKEERELRLAEKLLLKMRRKAKRAVSEDKAALVRYYSALSSSDAEIRCKKPQKLESLKRRLEHLLTERDEINTRLCELYGASAFAEPSRIDKKASRIKLKYTRMLYKSQKKHARRLEKLHAPVDLKKKIYGLMNKKTEACSDIEETRYLLKRKNPTGAKRRELKLKIKQSKQTLRYINADIKFFYKKAEKHNDRHIDEIIHTVWVVGALFVAIAGIIVWQNFEAVRAWLSGVFRR